MSTSLSIERTHGELVDANGQRINLPAQIIGADAAALIRNYFFWAIQNQLEPELFCASCYDGTRESKAQYNINESEIQIICGCRLLFFQGTWLKPTAFGTAQTAPVDATGPLQMRLSEDVARLLRHYKKVLQDLGLKEALRCNACYALNQEDGCEAQVGASQIRIRCRCTSRTHQGLSL